MASRRSPLVNNIYSQVIAVSDMQLGRGSKALKGMPRGARAMNFPSQIWGGRSEKP